MARERVDVLQADGRVVRDQRLPMLRRRRGDRGGADLEVGAGRVVHDEEPVLAAEHGVVEGVLHAFTPLREDPEARVGVVRVEEAVLGRRLRPGGDDEETVAAGPADADEEPLVGLVVDQLVVGLRGAQPVPPDLVGAPGVVDGRVVEALAGPVPGRAADDAGDLVVEHAGREVLDPDRVALVADHIGRVRQHRAVRADAGTAQGEELVALGELVEVEQHLLARQRRGVRPGVLVGTRRRPVVRPAHRDPAAGAVLLPLERAAVVPEPAAAGRHREVGLEGAGLDLVEDRLTKAAQVRGPVLRVGVLRLEVRRHLGGALRPQPVVLVDPGPAVVLGGDRTALCCWRSGDGWLHVGEPTQAIGSVRDEVRRPERRPRRGGHRRRGAPRGGHQRERRLRLPRRQRRDHGVGLRAGRCPGRLGRGAGLLRRPRELRAGGPGGRARRAARAGRRPGGHAGRDRGKGRHRGDAT